MKAVKTVPPGGFANTALVEIDEPALATGQVLVELRAVGLNPADYFQIDGQYPGGPKPPFIPGRDGAGVVLASQDPKIAVGDSVVVLQTAAIDLVNGTLCPRQRFAGNTLAPLPSGWSFEEGGAAPLVYQTAWQALVDRGGLKQGDTVVVTGASGGVGSAAVQLAVALGAQVVALSRSAEKRQKLLEIGAQHALDPNAKDIRDQIFTAVKKKGIDIVVENIGGASLGDSVRLLGVKGRVCVVGLLAGVEGTVPIPSLMFKQASIHGVVVYSYTPDEAQAVWGKIVQTLAQAGQRPIIDSRFPLEQWQSAFERLRASPFGKVIVTS